MTHFDDFLQRLTNAANDDERSWLITQNLLENLPHDLAQLAWAAAVPHWFDEKILAALKPELTDDMSELYAQLKKLPFVEAYEGKGHNIHEVTRDLMLAHLWENCNDEYITLSQLASNWFEQLFTEQGADNIRSQSTAQEHFENDQNCIEAIYHLLIS